MNHSVGTYFFIDAVDSSTSFCAFALADTCRVIGSDPRGVELVGVPLAGIGKPFRAFNSHSGVPVAGEVAGCCGNIGGTGVDCVGMG